MKKGLSVLLLFPLLVFFLTGCMYPEDKLVQNEIPYQDQIQSVQAAVTQFQEDKGGILPIKTSEETTPIYQKYLIDFKRIVPEYLAEPPGNSFESGGVFQYVIVNAEKDPTVKIFDLRIADMLGEINLRIKMQGYPPFKEKVAENVYTLNFEKLGYKEPPYVVSPYTQQNLSFVINGNAEVFVDYRNDLYEAMRKGEHHYQTGEDIRAILLKDSPFVPAYSLPYTIDESTNEPIFLMK
ncbi:hypothetical protein JMM81_02620 [Bacillus sp. V3B]|uniref:hypothetical protein n=1 Tax=Bacillus sp. V3B TaxID=2804915 RepID=UPI002109AC86|nr:hypothetical protein [Bacillus sp. V3B]MCQ6273871.1 hypothetical protein [Bacillus sp. V3B]